MGVRRNRHLHVMRKRRFYVDASSGEGSLAQQECGAKDDLPGLRVMDLVVAAKDNEQ